MKHQTAALSLFLALTACGTRDYTAAASKVYTDTSGCSPLLKTDETVKTVQNFSLRVASEMPNQRGCWNVNRSRVFISYGWKQESEMPRFATIGLWMRFDGTEQFVEVTPSCAQDRSGFYCTASTSLNKFVSRIEIAPVRQGVWDTAGIGQNYTFQLR
jgi:hypothetical protein